MFIHIITVYLFINYTIINICIGLDSWQSDSGDIREKEHLPIKQVRFGDTGTTLDEKEGRFKVGPLMCEGDGKFLFYLKKKKTNFYLQMSVFVLFCRAF